jgi:hypothetical protein
MEAKNYLGCVYRCIFTLMVFRYSLKNAKRRNGFVVKSLIAVGDLDQKYRPDGKVVLQKVRFLTMLLMKLKSRLAINTVAYG